MRDGSQYARGSVSQVVGCQLAAKEENVFKTATGRIWEDLDLYGGKAGEKGDASAVSMTTWQLQTQSRLTRGGDGDAEEVGAVVARQEGGESPNTASERGLEEQSS